jgi:hypothetical protein
MSAVVPTPISPKVIVATVAAVVVPALLAVGTYVLANQDVLGINNPVLGVFVVALITGGVTFLSSYAKRDPLREAGQAAIDTGQVPDPAA